MHEDIVLTPMMKQFLDLKAKHPDAVMLFRCGDFYETYSTDAVVASEILGITLTKRANGKGKTIEMAGFPPLMETPGVTSSVMPRFTSFFVNFGSSNWSQMATRLPARISLGR